VLGSAIPALIQYTGSMPVGLKRHLDRRRTHDASVISRELLERVDHGTKEVNDALVRLVARSVAGDIRTFVTELSG